MASKVENFSTFEYQKRRSIQYAVAFINKTVIVIARLGCEGINERVVYNGHKRNHALKFQVITASDIICLHLFGPEVGRRYDMYLYATSGVDAILQENIKIENKQYVGYRDSGYIRKINLEIAFEGPHLDEEQKPSTWKCENRL